MNVNGLIGAVTRLILLFGFLLCVTIAEGQELNIKQYTVHDGLKQMQVNGLHQDSIGNLWISTRGGLSRFNGASFDNFEDVPCIPDYVIQTTQDSKGNIWILTGSKLIKFDGKECEEFPFPKGFKADQFATIYEYMPNFFIIWDVTMGRYEWVFKEGAFLKIESIFEEIGDDGVRFIARDGEWIYFLTDHQELLIYNQDQFVKRTSVKKNVSIPTNKTDGSFSNFPNLLINEPESQWTIRYRIDKNKSFELVKNCAINRITREHIYEENAQLHNRYSITDKIELGITPLNQLITIDNVKNKWNKVWRISEIDEVKYFETDRGLGVVKNEPFFQIPESDLPYIWTVIENEKGEMLFGGYDQGIKKQVGRDFVEQKRFDPGCSQNHPIHHLKQIYFGASILNKKVYFPSGKGILKEANEGFRLIKANCKKGVKDASLYTYPDTLRNVLIDCACQGVNIWDVDNEILLKNISRDSLQQQSCVLTAVIDRQGDYWFGYRPHIARYNPVSETIKIYDNDQNDAMNTYVSSSMDTDGQLWFGGRKGMVYYDAELDSMMRFPLFEDQMVSALYSYSEDKLFASLEDGIAMINIKKYKESGELQYQLFNQYNGYMGIEPNQNGLFLDSKDRLWITSATHLSYTYPKLLNYTHYKLRPNIVSINAERTNYHNDIIEIEKGDNDVTIIYEAIGIKRPNEILYSYQLDEEGWSEWTTNTTALINGIGSGEHSIKVKIRTDNQEDFPAAQSSFSINIPFYREPHFGYSMAFLASWTFGVLLFVGYRNRSLSVENKLIEDKKVLSDRLNAQLIKSNSELKQEINELSIAIDKVKVNPFDLEMIPLGKKGEILVKPIDIICAEAGGNLLTVHMKNGRKESIWMTLKALQELLPSGLFVKANRSFLFNIKELTSRDGQHIKLTNAMSTQLTKSGKSQLDKILNS